jgi:hypothetical protein
MTPREGEIIPPDALAGYLQFRLRSDLDELLATYPQEREAVQFLQALLTDALERKRRQING